MQVFDLDGVKTAVLNILVDPENGFQDLSLTDEEGGVLYVPQGEEVTPIMGEMVSESRDTVFVIGQDYHPRNHISFMVNHPGIMEYRINKFKEFLEQNGQPVPTDREELYKRAQQPVHFFNGYDNPPVAFPFSEIVLDAKRNIIGLKEEDGRIRRVQVETSSGLEPDEKDRGRVTAVSPEYFPKTFDEYRAEGTLLSTQTLWTVHCVQGTRSSLYPKNLNLPEGLKRKLAGDLKANYIYHRDAETGNEFFVIRKGDNSEVDSYGIGLENDGETLTIAWEVFFRIAKSLKAQGCQRVIINVGGLATNFCVEFSLNNTTDFLAGHFKNGGMATQINFVPEISRGIPLAVPIDNPFSLEGAEARFAKRGVGKISVAEIMALQPQPPVSELKAAFPASVPG